MSNKQGFLFEHTVNSFLIEQEKKTQLVSKTLEICREYTNSVVTESSLRKIIGQDLLSEADEFRVGDIQIQDDPVDSGEEKSIEKSGTKDVLTKIGVKIANFIVNKLIPFLGRLSLAIMSKQVDNILKDIKDRNPNSSTLTEEMVKESLGLMTKSILAQLASEGAIMGATGIPGLGRILKSKLGKTVVGFLGKPAIIAIKKIVGAKATDFIINMIKEIMIAASTGQTNKNTKWLDTAIEKYNKAVDNFVNTVAYPRFIKNFPLKDLQKRYSKMRGEQVPTDDSSEEEIIDMSFMEPEEEDRGQRQLRQLQQIRQGRLRQARQNKITEHKVYNRWKLIAGIK
jgi:hypothetical protein